MNWLFCEILFACAVSAAPMPLDELTYRTALFDYYQDDTQSALVDVLVAQAQGRTGEDSLRFDLARGSFAFDQGMVRYARDTFDAIPDDRLTDTDRLRLAFHQSRLNLQQQDWDALSGTLQSLASAETALAVTPHAESTFMRSELALAHGDAEGAETLLDTLQDDEPWKAYGLFNAAVARHAGGDAAGAQRLLDDLDALEVTSAETADLKQRGRLAMAWLAGKTDRAADAQAVLEDLPESSRYRDSALAAYGNLAMSRQDYALAARIWLTLKDDDRWMSSGAIARIGFPLALHRLAEPDNVLAHYRAAAGEFEARLAVLGEVDRQLQDAGWVRELASAMTTSAVQHDANAPLLPEELGARIGPAEWLNWLASEDVHAVFEEWQALHRMATWLRTLPPTLEAFAQVSAEQKRRTARLGQVLDDDGLLARRDTLAQALADATRKLDVLDRMTPVPTPEWAGLIATDAERVSLDHLFGLEAAVERAPAADREALRARIKRLLGAMFWTLADDLPARRWNLTRQVRALERDVAAIDVRIARIRGAEDDYVATVIPRFESYRERALALRDTVNAAAQEREQRIAGLVRNRLREETRQIEQYLFLTRVAIAEVSDRLAAVELPAGARGARQ